MASEITNISVSKESLNITVNDDFDVLTNRPKYAGKVMTHSTNIPTVPTKVSQLTNDLGYITEVSIDNELDEYAKKDTLADIAFTGNYDDLKNKPDNDLSNYYNKNETNTLLATKANIDNVYDKSQVESLVSHKANVDDVYNKTEINSLLGEKADFADVYTKQQTDNLLDNKITKPQGGTTGQVLTKTDTGTEWADTATVGQLNTKQNLTLTAINQIPKLVKGTYTISGGYYICNGFVSTSSKSLFVDFPMPFVCDGTVTVNSITMSARGVTGYLTDTTSSRVNFLETLATLASVYVHPTGGITIELSKAEGTWIDSSLNNTPVCTYVTGLSFTVS